MSENQGYGYQDTTDIGSGVKFGLNNGTFTLKEFSYNPNGGKDGSEQDSIDIVFTSGGRDYNYRQFPVGKIFGDNGELTDVNSDEYKKAKNKAIAELNGVFTDIVKCFVSEEDLKMALGQNIKDFENFARILEGLVKSKNDWNKVPLDMFLQYQWEPKDDNTRTFLEIPKKRHLKHGKFICKSIQPQSGSWSEVRNETSLTYVDGAGNQHPFKRGQWYINSNFANPISTSNGGNNPLETGNASGGATWKQS